MYLVQGVVIGGNKVVIKIPLITTRYTLIISELSVSVIFVALIWRKIIFLLMNSPDSPSLLNAWDDWTNQNFWSVHPYLSVAFCSLYTHKRSWFQLKVPWWIVKQKFRKLAPHALKGQKLIAQGYGLLSLQPGSGLFLQFLDFLQWKLCGRCHLRFRKAHW